MTHDIDTLAAQAYYDAVRRGKTDQAVEHWQDYQGIREELKEFLNADELAESDHLPGYTQASEELADVIISCMTELHKRGASVGEIIKAKVEFNSTRK